MYIIIVFHLKSNQWWKSCSTVMCFPTYSNYQHVNPLTVYTESNKNI